MKTRRQILQGAATAATFPILGAQHSHTSNDSGGSPKPKVLSDAELAKLAQLIDLIIPRSDTPGASDARVHFFIDRSLHLEKRAPEYRNGWRSLDQFARQMHKAAFSTLDAQRQIEILTAAGGNPYSDAGRFIEWMKGLTVDGYYTSKEGLVHELGWKGNTYLAEFEGCTHPEHQG